MSGNKVSKAKGKYDKSKGTSIVPPNEDTEDYDFSVLRKPIQTNITGFGQAKKIFDLATEELKTLLSEECDVLYECKVCRSLFRSLANFISHKRVYCKDTFNSNVHGHFVQPSPLQIEMKKIQATEEGYKTSLREKINMEVDDDDRIPLTKDLTTIVEKLAKKSTQPMSKDLQVALQEIPSTSVAVFQNIENGLEGDSENMLNQVSELDKLLSKDMGVMQMDGSFKCHNPNDLDNIIQISDDEDCTDPLQLKCKICDMQFSTQKTLKFHMKYKHVESRLVYPCPDCLDIFSTSWSVYRHLFKVHRKSAAQIRRLRESIQAKAFKMNNPPAFYERRKNNQKTPAAPKITEEERIEQENQAWMDNMEFDGEISRCGGCGRTFERRAALAAHTHTCQPRSRALARRPETKRIEIQIRKDYNKGPNANKTLLKPADTESKSKIEPVDEAADKETEKDLDKESENPEFDDNNDENSMDSDSRQSEEESNASESPEKNEPKVENETPQEPDPPTKTEQSTPETPEVDTEQAQAPPNVVRLPFAQHAEKSNLMALRQRIFGDIELDKLLCKRCNTRCEHIRDLYDHVATHYKWMRYACKLCNFKHYNFDQLPDHVKIVHKLKGDKDFYFSTVKALDGAEALELSVTPDESVENEVSPESRRPSRCSSDSSRLSDDSSSSSTRVEGTRKRKVQQYSRYGKRKKESLIKANKEEDGERDDNDSSSNHKTFEENSSDIDDAYEKVEKKPIEVISSVASRRPVRRKTKPKNEDFEYDLSNLLKLEAQGYRDNQTTTGTAKTTQTKKKPQTENLISFEILNKECCGALDTLSRKAVQNSKAQMKTSSFPVYSVSQNERPSNIFARPMLPKSLSKGDKSSPKKDIEEKKDTSPNTEQKNKTPNEESLLKPIEKESSKIKVTSGDNPATASKEQTHPKKPNEPPHLKSKTIQSIVPIKFRRQSLDVMKNPLINKNIKDFTKAGMKTKILVIKPIKVKDGGQTPLQFQTIKLKDPSRKSTGEDKSDQVVVVKVPNVERNVVLPASDSAVLTKNETQKFIEKEAEIDQTPKNDTVDSVPNGNNENAATTKSDKSVEDISVKPSEVNLLCNENISKTIDATCGINKPTLLKLDNQTTSSNGIS